MANRIIGVLTDAATRAIEMQAQLSRGKGPDPFDVTLPSEFTKAWYHLFACILLWKWDALDSSWKHARKCKRELEKAYDALMSKSKGKELLEMKSLLPIDLAVFCIKTVLDGIPNDQPDICEAYWEYHTELVRSAIPALVSSAHSWVIIVRRYTSRAPQPVPSVQNIPAHRRD
jgi:hypothetical protein